MRSKARTKKPSPPTHASQSSSNAPANLLFSSSLWMSRRNPDKHRKRMQDCGLWLCGFDHGLKPNGQGNPPACLGTSAAIQTFRARFQELAAAPAAKPRSGRLSDTNHAEDTKH